jgi:hypothetical protein
MIYFKKPIKCIKLQQSGLLLGTLSTENCWLCNKYAFYDSVLLWVNTLKSATWTYLYVFSAFEFRKFSKEYISVFGSFCIMYYLSSWPHANVFHTEVSINVLVKPISTHSERPGGPQSSGPSEHRGTVGIHPNHHLAATLTLFTRG